MFSPFTKRIFGFTAGFFVLWLSTKYLLPLLAPFLLGGLFALLSEPAVSFSQKKLKLQRPWAAGAGVAVTLLALVGLLSGLGAILIRTLLALADGLPNMEKTARDGLDVLEGWVVELSYKAPAGMQPMLTRTVENTFSGGGIFVEQLSQSIPAFIGNLLSGVPDSALRLGTAVLSAFMLSARIPRLKAYWQTHQPAKWNEQYLPALRRAKKALLGWLKAQGVLMLVIFSIVTAGLLLLRIPYAPFWALFIALLDAVPMLGTGLVLVPWAIICFLMRQSVRALGLLGIVVCATVARTTLEPKLLGKHLGLDPLITLLALYIGYKIWGFWGLLAAPVLTAALLSALPKNT